MYHRMTRRSFLVDSCRTIFGFSFLPFVAREKVRQISTEPIDDDTYKTLTADLEKQIPKLMEEAVVPGISIAIIKDAKLFWTKGFGVKNSVSKEPIDNDTVFEAASMSKPVFAYAVMKLCEKGVMNLDTPLTEYAQKPFLEGDARLELITARHVLCHTSGFQNLRSNKNPLKIHFTPGEKFLYSGEGYYYLQSVVRHLTAQPIEPYMKANLFLPFSMTSSGYVWNDTFKKHAAQPHDEKGKPFKKYKPTEANAARYAAMGDLHTTPTDYAKFLIEVIDPKPSDEFRLNRESLLEMLRPHVKVDDSSSWALGWKILHTEKGDFIQHGGGNDGFICGSKASVAKKFGFVIMTNSDNGNKVIKHEIFKETMKRFIEG